VVDGERSKIARLDTEVADDVVALIVIIAARSKTHSVACAYFRQKISFVGQLEPINKRAYRAIGGKSALAGRVLEIIGIGFKRVGAVRRKSRETPAVYSRSVERNKPWNVATEVK